jgi:hypothetical protein
VLRLIGRQLALAGMLAAAQLGGLGLLYGLLGARLLEDRLGWLLRVCSMGEPLHEWQALGGTAALLAFLAALPLRRLRWLGLVHACAFLLGGWLLVSSIARDCLGNTWRDVEILALLVHQADLLLCALLAWLPCALLGRLLTGARAAPGAAGSAR